MRKAVLGAIALAVFALTFGSPIREMRSIHGVVSLAGLAGYLLLSFDPPVASPRQRQFLIAGVVASLAAFILVVSGTPYPANLVARVLAVASVALPLWLVARPPQFAFVAAGALALFSGLPAVADAGPYATSIHSYVAAAAALWVAWVIHSPIREAAAERRPRIVVAYDVVRLTDEEKAERLAALEKRYRAGELEEHKYWDKRQEIESR